MCEPVPLSVALADEAATHALAAALAAAWRRAPGPLFVALDGPLGAGKTTFVRGFLAALGVRDPVKSPTYTLLETYPLEAGRQVHHMDWYRLSDAEGVESTGFRDLAGPDDACLVEWAARVPGAARGADVAIALTLAANGRQATLGALTDRGRAVLGGMGAGKAHQT